jgi:hypothetical protein
MLFERTDTGALSRFWQHIENCNECSPEGACPECKKLLEAVKYATKASAASSPDYFPPRSKPWQIADSLHLYSDAELIRALDTVTAVGSNETRRQAILAEIDRRARMISSG